MKKCNLLIFRATAMFCLLLLACYARGTGQDVGLPKLCGTSMAAPQVAGVAALILERNPKLTAEQVRTVIARSARKMGKDFRKNDEAFDYGETKEYGLWNYYFGYGVVDAYNAVLLTPVY